jgi:hypothetical protein
LSTHGQVALDRVHYRFSVTHDADPVFVGGLNPGTGPGSGIHRFRRKMSQFSAITDVHLQPLFFTQANNHER